MRNEQAIDWVSVEFPSELDALIGRYITGEQPQVHWETSHAHMRFDTVEEGLEALREPYFQQFIPASMRSATVLREVQEFEPYATDLGAAWRVVERLATPRQPFRIWRDRQQWCAAFGDFSPVSAHTAPIAICQAALRLRGLEVAIASQGESAGSRAALPPRDV